MVMLSEEATPPAAVDLNPLIAFSRRCVSGRNGSRPRCRERVSASGLWFDWETIS